MKTAAAGTVGNAKKGRAGARLDDVPITSETDVEWRMRCTRPGIHLAHPQRERPH